MICERIHWNRRPVRSSHNILVSGRSINQIQSLANVFRLSSNRRQHNHGNLIRARVCCHSCVNQRRVHRTRFTVRTVIVWTRHSSVTASMTVAMAQMKSIVRRTVISICNLVVTSSNHRIIHTNTTLCRSVNGFWKDRSAATSSCNFKTSKPKKHSTPFRFWSVDAQKTKLFHWQHFPAAKNLWTNHSSPPRTSWSSNSRRTEVLNAKASAQHGKLSHKIAVEFYALQHNRKYWRVQAFRSSTLAVLSVCTSFKHSQVELSPSKFKT